MKRDLNKELKKILKKFVITDINMPLNWDNGSHVTITIKAFEKK